MIRANKFLEEIYNDLGRLLFLIYWGKQYYISFYDDAIRTYHIKTIWHKGQAFEKFLEFISWAKNQSGKMLKRYRIDEGKEFDNKALKT